MSQGTNFFQAGSPTVNVALQAPDGSGNAFIVAGSSPSAVSGYAIGCLLVDTVAGVLYINTGTTATATWTRVGAQ